jgi:hypothetical protein
MVVLAQWWVFFWEQLELGNYPRQRRWTSWHQLDSPSQMLLPPSSMTSTDWNTYLPTLIYGTAGAIYLYLNYNI